MTGVSEKIRGDRVQIVEMLRGLAITRGLDESQLEALSAVAEIRSYDAGEDILEEGIRNENLYLLTSGTCDVLKFDESIDHAHVVNQIAPGAVFGEMSLFQDEATSASVRATGLVQLLVWSGDVLSREALGSTYDVLRGNIGELSMDRQRRTTDRFVESLRDSLQQERERREFGILVSVIVILVGIDHAVAELSHRTNVDISSQSFSWGALLAFGVPLFYFVWRTGQPAHVFGITTRGWKRAVSESLGIAGPLIALAVATKWIFMQTGVMDEGPLFTTKTFYSTALFFSGLAGVIASRMLGFLHHATQELLMRGVVQGALYRLYGRESPLSAIAATSAIFATAHLFIGVPLALMTFGGGMFFGWLYARHGTLIGVTLLHFILHTTMKFLGLL